MFASIADSSLSDDATVIISVNVDGKVVASILAINEGKNLINLLNGNNPLSRLPFEIMMSNETISLFASFSSQE